MIQIPAVVLEEWVAAATVAEAEDKLRVQIEHDSLVSREVERLRIRHEAAVQFQQELDAEDTPPLEIGTLTQFLSNPASAPKDMIEGVMKEDGLTVVLGPSGSGKSTLALQMLHSLMTGDDFLGQTSHQISGAVGLLSYDMEASMLYDWMAGFPNINPNSVSIVNAYKRGNPVGVTTTREQIASAWKSLGVEVIVLDSFSASFFGQNQNDAAETMAHYRDMKKFALTECGAKALIVIVHSTDSSPKKARGSTVHKDTADSMIAVTVDEQTTLRTVSVEKYREARGQHMMTPRVVGAPDSVTHLVDVDLGAMTLAGYPVPPALSAKMFTNPMPTVFNTPDTESDEEEDDDL